MTLQLTGGSEADEGFCAFCNGVLRSENPYPSATLANLRWDGGWIEARDKAAADMNKLDKPSDLRK